MCIRDSSYPGDIVGLHDTGNFIIGDTLTSGEQIKYKGIPRFSPEHFRFINNDDPLIIANSDQYINWNSSKAFYDFNSKNLDGAILTFEAIHPKWSYAKCDDQGFVTEVAEKKVISNNATVGVYYWKDGEDFVQKFHNQDIGPAWACNEPINLKDNLQRIKEGVYCAPKTIRRILLSR